MESKEESKILRIIRKLLALSSNNPNEHEAASALSRANELLVKHNLSMTDLGEDAGIVIEDRLAFKSRLRYPIFLAVEIAKYNFCNLLLISKRGSGYYVFVGRKDNIEATKVMYQWVLTWSNLKLLDAMREIDKFGEGYLYGKLKFKESFGMGVMYRLRNRFEDIRKRNEPVFVNNCKDLVVKTGVENEEYVRKSFGKTKKQKFKFNGVDSVAENMGFKAGGTLPLDKELAYGNLR